MLVGARHSCPVHDGARGWTVAIDAVGPRAQHNHIFAGYLLRAVERELLIAPADARLPATFTVTSPPETRQARDAAAQFAQPRSR